MKLLKTGALIASLSFSSLSFAELTVIVNPANDSAITSKDIQRIFLGKEAKFPNGTQAIPINLSSGGATREAFDEKILERSSSQVSAYWSKLVFTGKGIPPKEVTSDAEVVSLVAKNPSLIGYVDSSSLTDAVKPVK